MIDPADDEEQGGGVVEGHLERTQILAIKTNMCLEGVITKLPTYMMRSKNFRKMLLFNLDRLGCNLTSWWTKQRCAVMPIRLTRTNWNNSRDLFRDLWCVLLGRPFTMTVPNYYNSRIKRMFFLVYCIIV